MKRGLGPSFFYLNVYECNPPTQTLEDDVHLLALCLPCSERDVCPAISLASGPASAGEDVGFHGDFSSLNGGGTAQVASALLGLDYQVDLSGQIGSVALPPTGQLRRKR